MIANIGITGSSGFIGYHLTSSLKQNSNFKLVLISKEDFNSIDSLSSKLKKCDFLIHLAGINRHSDKNYIYNENIDLVNKLVDALSLSNSSIKIIFASSFQEKNDSEYGRAKLKCRKILEKWVETSNSEIVSVIIPNVFGPFCRPNYNSFIATFCYQIINDENPNVIKDNIIKLIFVLDLVQVFKNILMDFDEFEKVLFIKDTFQISVSDTLEVLKDFNNKYGKCHIIPELKNSFFKNLFLTYHSYLTMGQKLKNNILKIEDQRGYFCEVYKSFSETQVSFSVTKPGVTRGDHYHTRKIERFVILKGSASIKLRKIGTNEILEHKINGNEPKFIDMPVWYTHNITNIGEEDLITLFCIDSHYQDDTPDTFFEKV